MNIYFSGLGGVGIGPLAQIARDAGVTVMGSDLAESLVTNELRLQNITFSIGQDGTFAIVVFHAHDAFVQKCHTLSLMLSELPTQQRIDHNVHNLLALGHTIWSSHDQSILSMTRANPHIN